MLTRLEFLGSDKPDQVANPREAFFAAFAERAKAAVGHRTMIMVTGGLRTRTGMASLIASGTTDLVGVARPAAIEPRLPLKLLDPSIPDDEARAVRYEIRGASVWRQVMPRILGAGITSLFHNVAMHRIAKSKTPDPHQHFLHAVYELNACSAAP